MSEKPVHTIRIGAVKASIWENKGGEGKVFHTTSVVRCYKDENDQWRESASYLPDGLPKVDSQCGKLLSSSSLHGARGERA